MIPEQSLGTMNIPKMQMPLLTPRHASQWNAKSVDSYLMVVDFVLFVSFVVQLRSFA
jgi:hypothetical protein